MRAGRVGLGLGADHVLLAHLGGVAAQRPGHQFHGPLADEGRLGLAESPVSADGHGVGGNEPSGSLHGVPRVGPRRHAERHEQRPPGEDAALRSGVAHGVDPQAAQRAVVVEGHVHVADLAAPVGGRQQRLGPALGPQHRTPRFQRGDDHHQLVLVEMVLQAEPAPHVGCDHPHAVLRHAEHRADGVAHAVRRLRGDVDHELAAGLGVRQHAAALHGRPAEATDHQPGAQPPVGRGEDRVGVLGCVAGCARPQQVPLDGVPQLRRPLRQRLVRIGHRRQFPDDRQDRLGGVGCGGGARGHDDGDRLARIAHPAVQQRRGRLVLGGELPQHGEVPRRPAAQLPGADQPGARGQTAGLQALQDPVSDRAADHGGVQHVRPCRRQVGHVARRAAQHRFVVDPGHAPADEAGAHRRPPAAFRIGPFMPGRE